MTIRLNVTYWPVWGGRPALGLHRTPDPTCTDCDGSGYVADDPECIDERACRCAPDKPIALLPLPWIVNRHYRRRLVRRLRARSA